MPHTTHVCVHAAWQSHAHDQQYVLLSSPAVASVRLLEDRLGRAIMYACRGQ
jgi:hypothetical protein